MHRKCNNSTKFTDVEPRRPWPAMAHFGRLTSTEYIWRCWWTRWRTVHIPEHWFESSIAHYFIWPFSHPATTIAGSVDWRPRREHNPVYWATWLSGVHVCG